MTMDRPSNWINRDFQELIRSPEALGPFSVLLLLGPRQVGKSSLLNLSAPRDTLKIDLDDLETRTRANGDPILFGRELRVPLFIDEIQYAPSLLSQIKILADKNHQALKIMLTGSQSFEVMRGVRESLAGRVVILNLFGLSLHEKKISAMTSPIELFKEFFIGTFPALRTNSETIWTRYMSSYVQTYIQRDVAELLGIQKRREFELFLKACALRTGQLINYEELARDSAISATTAKVWLSILEDSFLIKLIHPYFTNRTRRLIKTPKLYFIDSGLCAYLAGWRDSEQIRIGPWAGSFFETVIFGEIIRYFTNQGLDYQIHFWRDKDGNEIDFLVETIGKTYPIEVKLGTPNHRDLLNLDTLKIPDVEDGVVVSLSASNTNQGEKVWIKNRWRLSGVVIDFL